MKNVVRVKRYNNRKLYLVDEHRYTNVEEVALLMEGGFELEAHSHDTGLDITPLLRAWIPLQMEMKKAKRNFKRRLQIQRLIGPRDDSLDD